MKTLLVILFFASTLSCGQQKQLQESTADEAVTSLIENQDYIFTVRTTLPTGGRAIQANSQYDMQVSKDSVVTHLPYFGRAFAAPMGSTDGGIRFTSTDFQYTTEPRKKGGWLVKIKPNDRRDIQQIFLTVTETGSASLQVTSANRQPISYSGLISKRPT